MGTGTIPSPASVLGTITSQPFEWFFPRLQLVPYLRALTRTLLNAVGQLSAYLQSSVSVRFLCSVPLSYEL